MPEKIKLKTHLKIFLLKFLKKISNYSKFINNKIRFMIYGLVTVPNLEIHIAHGCNLSCVSCSHYSDQNHKGVLSLEEFQDSLKLWKNKIFPEIFTLLGGEPAINKNLPHFLELARQHFPRAHLRLITNGFLLDRHPTLPAVMKMVGNASLILSIHHDSIEYQDKLKVVNKLLEQWINHFGITVQKWPSNNFWTKRYHGKGLHFLPFDDGNPEVSWEICPAKYCLQLFEGKIWKCPPLAYLKLQNEKYSLHSSWDYYLKYQPIESSCTKHQLQEFISRKAETYCGMCPSKQHFFAMPNPLRGSIVQ